MPLKKIFNIIIGLIIALMLLSAAFAMSASSFIRDDPKVPDSGTGHIVALAIRGYGTRYLTQREWDSVAMYWDIFYGMMSLVFAAVIIRVIAEAYIGFMRGWRSESNN